MTTIFFGDGNDDWEPSENDESLNEDDEWHGGGGDDILIGDLYGVLPLTTKGGIDVLFGDAGNDQLSGQAGNDKLYGGADNDKLFGDLLRYGVDIGLRGDDQLFGEAGDDELDGSDGNDLLVGGSGADKMIGGNGNDTADYSTSTVGVQAWIGGECKFGDAQGDQIDLDVENLTGSNFADLLVGTTADNLLQGLDGDDQLYGGAGHDTFYGGNGNDTEYGGPGGDGFYGGGGAKDIVSYYAQAEGVFLRIGVGTALGGDADGDFIAESIEGIHGSNFGNDTIFGSTANNLLYGFGGDDLLSGGVGADLLDGGAGIDEANYLSAAAGVRVDLLGPLINTGEATGDTYNSIENLTGSTFDDQLLGTEEANIIDGKEGVDEIRARGGDDTLNGGLGFDALFGSDGGDTYILDDVTVSGALGTAHYDTVFEDSQSGLDTVLVNADAMQGLSAAPGYTLAAEVENGTIYNAADFRLTGNGSANTLTGSEGVNVLSGLAANDMLNGGGGLDDLRGGDGDDTYVLFDVSQPDPNTASSYDKVTETAGGGTDSLWIMSGIGKFGYTLGTQVENATVFGDAAFALTGNDLRNRLDGNDADNSLNGLEGNDTLNGGGGHDTLGGGLGNDIYVLGDLWGASSISKGSYDDVAESLDGGTDTVRVEQAGTLRKYVLAANIENGTVTGEQGFSLTGNGLDNVLSGNDTRNGLSGRAGNDRLIGDAGEDSLDGGAGADRLQGGLGGDRLAGGGGGDTFEYRDIADSSAAVPPGQRDVITDFATGDTLDFSVIDARPGTANNQAFTFIGSAAFSAEGQIRAVQLGADTEIQVNTAGASGAEMRLLLLSVAAGTLDAGAFDL